ncbi:DUF4437 domain-containing protein, partial [Pseudoalteromonas sp. S2893]|uniref:DUF4437 domain-containing protein n=1 Tax=Pseudoalteromonas sp. S2893 TaxID=579530 RepID=UPI00110A86A9
VAARNIDWGYFNAPPGEKIHGGADLLVTRTTETSTGMLVRFKNGFESPPPIHNNPYRGNVSVGQKLNDDPTADKMWRPAGTCSTQPAVA